MGIVIELTRRTATAYYISDGREEMAQVPIKKLVPRLVKNIKKQIDTEETGTLLTPMLPPGVRMYQSYGETEIVVCEQSPQMRTIKWGQPPFDKEQVTYKVATPYVVYFFPFYKGVLQNEARIFYRTEPLKSLDDKLFLPNVTHCQYYINSTSSIGRICFEGKGNFQRPEEMSSAIDVAMSNFWDSSFQVYWGESRRGGFSMCPKVYARKKGSTFLGRPKFWEKRSLKNPLFVLDEKLWIDTSIDVNYILTAMRGQRASNNKYYYCDHVESISNVMQSIIEEEKEAERKKQEEQEEQERLQEEEKARRREEEARRMTQATPYQTTEIPEQTTVTVTPETQNTEQAIS